MRILIILGTLLTLLLLSEVAIAVTVANEFGPWHLLWAVPALLAMDIFIGREIDRMSRA